MAADAIDTKGADEWIQPVVSAKTEMNGTMGVRARKAGKNAGRKSGKKSNGKFSGEGEDVWKRDLAAFITIFVASTVGLAMLQYFFVFGKMGDDDLRSLKVPLTLTDAQTIGAVLSEYSYHHQLRVLIGHAATYLYLQSFAIPGTIFCNLLGGALFGLWKGYALCLIYNTIGSIFLYWISNFLGHRILLHSFPDKLEMLREKLDAHRGDMVWYMTSLRVFPFTPNWFVNVASPHLHIPLRQFAPAIMLGLTPYNFLSCKAGLMLSELRSKNDIIDTTTTAQLVVLALLGGVLPQLAKRGYLGASWAQ